MPPPGFSTPHGSRRADSVPIAASRWSSRSSTSATACPAARCGPEIVAALAQAGVHALEPAQGTSFDATTMRGVGSAPAPDPAWVGRVAATERAGFIDGGAIVRLPEVVVYTAGG